MKIPWWLHRTLIFILMPSGALAGAILGLYGAGLLDGILGRAVIGLLPLGFLLGAFVPHRIFHKHIHAKCPVDGKRMNIERVTLPQRYPQQVPRTGSRYRCEYCGIIK